MPISKEEGIFRSPMEKSPHRSFQREAVIYLIVEYIASNFRFNMRYLMVKKTTQTMLRRTYSLLTINIVLYMQKSQRYFGLKRSNDMESIEGYVIDSNHVKTNHLVSSICLGVFLA